MKKYKALLLDFYGTLATEDNHLIAPILTAIAEASSVSSDTGQIGRDWRFQALCREAFGASFRTQREIEVQSLRELLALYRADLDAEELAAPLFAHWREPDAFAESAAFLRNCPLPVCLVSNIDRADLDAALTHNGWRFENIVTSEECRAYKPRPEMFRRALELLNCRSEDALHIGDSLTSDVAGAQNIGMDAAWINRTGRPLPEGAIPPTVTISYLNEPFFN